MNSVFFDMPSHKAYFISDLHLGARYLDRFHERVVVEFLDKVVAKDAESLYLVGDVLDYWYEYRTVVPRGYVRFFGTLARLADSGVKIIWLTGNHDIWLFDYLRDEIGLTVVDGEVVTEIYGKRFYIAHGDAVGRLKPSFRFMRSLFRNKFCQKLYSAIHPRWTIPFAHAWSSHSRLNDTFAMEKVAPEEDSYVIFARDYNKIHCLEPVKYFIFGHRHEIFDYKDEKKSDAEIIILGDWISKFSYGTFDGEVFKIDCFYSKLSQK